MSLMATSLFLDNYEYIIELSDKIIKGRHYGRTVSCIFYIWDFRVWDNLCLYNI